jgi:tetratricopeptide (TPR) repeat protein
MEARKMTKTELTAESYRIRAIAHFMSRDLAQARLEIRKALEMEPRWESIRFAAAMIDYFSAMAGPAIPGRMVPWPEPVDWSMVRRDNDSIARLRESAKVFEDLSMRPGKSDEDRRTYETWRLACLANDPERQEEAKNYCQTLIQTYPAHSRAIVWAVARNYEIDLESSKRALESLLVAETTTPDQIIALISCHLAVDEKEEALGILDRASSEFEESGADDLWVVWRVQLLVLLGQSDEAIEFLDAQEESALFRDARTFALIAIGNKSNDWQPVIDHVEECYKETEAPRFLLDACELSARNGDWAYIAERSELLVESIGTGEAIRLAASAAFKIGRYKLCLDLVDGHLDLFRNRTLPPELRRIRAYSQQALGILPEAIADLEMLVQDQPTTENLLALTQLYFEKGEFKGLALVSRRLEGRDDLSTEASVRLARAVQWEDEDLARSLWRKAADQGIPDALVGEALALGFQLSLDDELRPLMSRMQDLGSRGEGGVQVKSVDDIALFATQHRDQITHLDTLYKSGRAPIHAIAASLNTSPAFLYHGVLAENELAPDPIRQPYVLIRHGGRGLPPGFPDPSDEELHLVLDVTALLVAQHLQILPEIERAYGPLQMPQDVVRSLIWMRERLTFHQPSRIDNYRQIVDLVEQGSLKVAGVELPPDYEGAILIDLLGEDWVSLLEEARAINGCVVDYLPLRRFGLDDPLAEVSAEYLDHLGNMRAIIQALRDSGPLSASEFEAALDGLGTEGQIAPSDRVPNLGSCLYLMGKIPEELARVDLLRTVVQQFEVYIQSDELAQARAALRQHSQMAELTEWLDDLISKVSRGIDTGTYLLLPRKPTEEEDAYAEDANPLLTSLRDLLKFDITQGHIIWADDRYLNSYARRDTAPIVGVNEILKSLVGLGALEPSDYYRRISALRAGNARFIPIQKDEIIFQLEEARVENHRILETRDLVTLRRYIAACMLQGEILQRPPLPDGAPNEQGEIAFAIGTARAIIDAVVEIWMLDDDEETRFARLEWLLANLYMDHLGIFTVTSLQRHDSEDLFFVATSLAGLISQAIIMSPLHSGEGPSLRKSYLSWLYSRIIQRRIESDPSIVPAIAGILKKSLLDAFTESAKHAPSIPATAVIQSFVQDLPEPVQEELSLDSDFSASIGFRTSIAVEGLQFDPTAFWKAASEAINGTESNIEALNVDKEIAFEPCEPVQGQLVFCIKQPDTEERKIVRNENLGLLVDSPSDRESFLHENKDWFDCSAERLDKLVAEIVSIEDPHLRMQKAESWQNASASVFYDRLLRQLHEKVPVDLADLRPPDGDALLRYFRFSDTGDLDQGFHHLLDKANHSLVETVGLRAAIERLSGLPVPLPDSLATCLLHKPIAERRSVIRHLLATACSPLSRMHLVHILSRSIADSPAYARLCRWLIVELVGADRSDDIEAFIAMLQWVNDDFGRWPEARSWSPTIRLSMVWAHTNQLFSIFSQAGAPVDWVKKTFGEPGLRVPYDMFNRDPTYRQDIAHPRMVSLEALLLGGLGYAIEETADSILNQQLREVILERTFTEINGRQYPCLTLLRDPTQARDSLGSFLGGDRSQRLSPLIGADSANIFSRISLEDSAAQALVRLEKDEEERTAWGELYAILGDLPPYRSISHDFAKILRGADYVELCQKDIPWGLLALQVASLQFANFDDDELGSRLNNQLIELATLLKSMDIEKAMHDTTGDLAPQKLEDIQGLLIEVASNISTGGGEFQPEEAVRQFRNTVSRMTNSWDSMREITQVIVQRLIEELPASEAKELWSLLLEFRAS